MFINQYNQLINDHCLLINDHLHEMYNVLQNKQP